MSSNNYMDRVPVKISENFKPPPKIYQLPQAISNKLQLSADHFNELPQYNYNFQLERKVLTKIPEWRRMRQEERDSRLDRKQRREQEKLLQIEAKNKQMLGAVSYPSTDDLSSSESDSDEHIQDKQNPELGANKVSEGETTLVNSFHNILQPTIVDINSGIFQSSNNTQVNSVSLTKTTKIGGTVKEVNTFNYKDFEEDTSSPFDNIELKTINDLDILAQVLHNSQLPKQKEERNGELTEDNNKTELESKDNTHTIKVNAENLNMHNLLLKTKDKSIDEDGLEDIENAKITLQKVDFEKLGQSNWGQNETIPNIDISNNSLSNIQFIGINSNIPTSSMLINSTFPNTQSNAQQYYQMCCSTQNNDSGEKIKIAQQTAEFNVNTAQGNTVIYGNHNYLQRNNYNDAIAAYCSPRHLQQHATTTVNNYACSGSNANNFGYLTDQCATCIQNPQKLNAASEYNEIDAKSKSVPDILKELSTEIRNSEIRRARYHSFNDEKEEIQSKNKQDLDEDKTPKQSPIKSLISGKETNFYIKLPPPAQRLVKNISSMGFPLERVAKISHIFGTDDKRIIEHLITLSELMDLGFDESKISDALIKFDNNKEKALEYLIS